MGCFRKISSTYYLTLIPVKDGTPASLWIENAFVRQVLSTVRGSLMSLSVSLPVLVRVALTERFSTSVTLAGPETVSLSAGLAAAEATKAAKAAAESVERMLNQMP